MMKTAVLPFDGFILKMKFSTNESHVFDAHPYLTF